MDAILLAGGFGTRLRPLTYTRPKPLLPVAGRPMLEWALDRLPEEVDRVIVTVNWRADDLRRYVAQSELGVEFVVVPESTPLGTGGAAKNCEAHLGDGPFMVLNADIVSDMDQEALVAAHRACQSNATISLKEVEPAEVVHYGVVRPSGAGPLAAVRIDSFVEKPATAAEAPSRLINAGAYVLERSVLDLIPSGRMVSMEKEIFPLLLATAGSSGANGFYGLPFTGAWIDVGDPVRLRQASRHLDASFAFGAHSVVSTAATVEESVGGARCHIGDGVTLRHSVLGDRVTVRAGVSLVDCVVGDDETVHQSATGERIWSKPVPEGYPDKQVGNALKR